MDSFKSLDYQFNDFEESEGDNTRFQSQGHVTYQDQGQMAGQGRPNFQALLSARQSGGGFRAHNPQSQHEIARETQIQTVHNAGNDCSAWDMSSGLNIQSESSTDKDNRPRRRGYNIPLNGTQTVQRDGTLNNEDSSRCARTKEAHVNRNVHEPYMDSRNTNDVEKRPESQTKGSDEVGLLLAKLKSEHSFNDWQTVEKKLRKVFEEDRMKTNDLNTERREKDVPVTKVERRFGNQRETQKTSAGQTNSPAASNRNSGEINRNTPVAQDKGLDGGDQANSSVAPKSDLDRINQANSPVTSETNKAVQPTSLQSRDGNQDQYASIDAYTEYMANNRDPRLAAKWGDKGQRAKGPSHVSYNAEPTDTTEMGATAIVTESKGSKRNKNVRRKKNATANAKTTDDDIETQRANATEATEGRNPDDNTNREDLLKNATKENEENEAKKHQHEIENWLDGAKEWAKENGFPEPTPSDQQTPFDEQSVLQQMPILGGNRGRRSAMPFGGSGNAFLGGQGRVRQQQQQMTRGMLSGMFGSPGGQQGLGTRQGLGRGAGGTGVGNLSGLLQARSAADFDPANIDQNSSEFIQQVLEYEMIKAKNNSSPKSDGMCTVVIVETSSSMNDGPLIEIGQFLVEFINGIEANKSRLELQENIAVITIGAASEVLQHITTNYELIRRAVDSVQFEGPSPLFMGFLLVQAVLAGHTTNGISGVNGHIITPRIILISSGFASGKAVGQWQQQNEAQQMLCAEILQNLAQTSMSRLFCVPVGQANKDFLDSMATLTGGKLMTTADAKLMSRSYIHHRAAGTLRNTRGTDIPDRSSIENVLRNDTQECTPADVDCVFDILRQGEPDLQDRDRRMQQMMETARQQQSQQGRMNDMQKMEQLQQLLGAMQGQGEEGLVDLLSQLQQEGAPGGGNLEELLRALQSMQTGGGTGLQGSSGGPAGLGLGTGQGDRGGDGWPPSQVGAGGQTAPQLGLGGGMQQFGGGGGLPQLGQGGGMPQFGRGGMSQFGSGGGNTQFGSGGGNPQFGSGGRNPLLGGGSGMSQLGGRTGMPQLGLGRGLLPGQFGSGGRWGPSQQGPGGGWPPGQ